MTLGYSITAIIFATHSPVLLHVFVQTAWCLSQRCSFKNLQIECIDVIPYKLLQLNYYNEFETSVTAAIIRR